MYMVTNNKYDLYEGQFKDHYKHGKGTYTYWNRNKHVGEYKDDKVFYFIFFDCLMSCFLMKIFYDIKRKMAKVLFFMLMVANGMANGGTTKEIKQLLNKD